MSRKSRQKKVKSFTIKGTLTGKTRSGKIGTKPIGPKIDLEIVTGEILVYFTCQWIPCSVDPMVADRMSPGSSSSHGHRIGEPYSIVHRQQVQEMNLSDTSMESIVEDRVRHLAWMKAARKPGCVSRLRSTPPWPTTMEQDVSTKKKKQKRQKRQKKKKGAQQDAPFCVGTVLLVWWSRDHYALSVFAHLALPLDINPQSPW